MHEKILNKSFTLLRVHTHLHIYAHLYIETVKINC